MRFYECLPMLTSKESTASPLVEPDPRDRKGTHVARGTVRTCLNKESNRIGEAADIEHDIDQHDHTVGASITSNLMVRYSYSIIYLEYTLN